MSSLRDDDGGGSSSSINNDGGGASGSGKRLYESIKAARNNPTTSSLKNESYELTGDPNKEEYDSASYSKAACGRANLRAAGWTDEDFTKPVVCVGIPYSNGLPCNNRIRELGDIIVECIERHGGKSILCNTPVISDGETNGSTGMKYSLPSRDLIADCIDCMYHGYMCDAILTLSGCDKTVPGVVMPLLRFDTVIGITLYAGSAQPGKLNGGQSTSDTTTTSSSGRVGLDAADVMEAIGAYGIGTMDIEDLYQMECIALPGSGTCSAMFTASKYYVNTRYDKTSERSGIWCVILLSMVTYICICTKHSFCLFTRRIYNKSNLQQRHNRYNE